MAASLEKSILNFSKIQNQIEYEENCQSCVVLLFHHADTTFVKLFIYNSFPQRVPHYVIKTPVKLSDVRIIVY